MLKQLLRRWLGLRCVLHCCPGTIHTSAPGKTWFQCAICGAQTKPE